MIKNLRVEPAIDVEFKRDTSFMEARRSRVLSADEIREFRISRGWTKTDLARELRTGSVDVGHWESGRYLCPKRYSDKIREMM